MRRSGSCYSSASGTPSCTRKFTLNITLRRPSDEDVKGGGLSHLHAQVREHAQGWKLLHNRIRDTLLRLQAHIEITPRGPSNGYERLKGLDCLHVQVRELAHERIRDSLLHLHAEIPFRGPLCGYERVGSLGRLHAQVRELLEKRIKDTLLHPQLHSEYHAQRAFR